MDRVFFSTDAQVPNTGGALATWNQPIEVVRVEVSSIFVIVTLADALLTPLLDAVYGYTGCFKRATSKSHGYEYVRVYISGERPKGSVPRRDTAYRFGYMADNLYGIPG